MVAQGQPRALLGLVGRTLGTPRWALLRGLTTGTMEHGGLPDLQCQAWITTKLF